jgi:hypothetical protein
MAVLFGPKDNTPDVKIKSTTYNHRLTEDGPEAQFETCVHYEVHCRFCGGYYMTPDVRSAIKWADSHEASAAHAYAVEEFRKAKD